ncbi:hypothetical protein H2198_008123 [Neophaeococcomyces mojaviensis]|uniref:Uncharacterized protein n=1 Tax=Neophaeococcomyces mojaviensis TaxID=3383035 RepID=A0ACC2ZYD5_9EURO|nr:hypothetical protein H2198_008123 [Knufia sp. JES_112]
MTSPKESTDRNQEQDFEMSRKAGQDLTTADAASVTKKTMSKKLDSEMSLSSSICQHRHHVPSEDIQSSMPTEQYSQSTTRTVDDSIVSQASNHNSTLNHEPQHQISATLERYQDNLTPSTNQELPLTESALLLENVPNKENGNDETQGSMSIQAENRQPSQDPNSQSVETLPAPVQQKEAQKLMNKRKIGQLLEDNHQWHEVLHQRNNHLVMLCMRSDGRLLEMDPTYFMNHSSTDEDQRMLLELAQGRHSQNELTLTLNRAGTRNYQILNSEQPCYCYACSRLFWNFQQGFSNVVDQQTASARVFNWVHNTVEKATEISNCLKRYEKSLRKRWSRKKSAAERKNMLKEICPMMLTHQTLQKFYDNNLALAPERRHGFLISNLNGDDLASDPDVLFEHLNSRAFHHPSAWFFADFMRIASMVNTHTVLHMEYAFGTFNITAQNYGTWHIWEDHAVHRFEAVSAPAAMLVFESQSAILDVLHQIVFQLVSDLQTPMAPIANDPHNWHTLSTNPVPIPNFSQVKSIFVGPSLPPSKLQEALYLSKEQLNQYTKSLAELRSSNFKFVERIKLSFGLEDAAGNAFWSKGALIAYHTLAAPHDRVVWWNMITQSIENLAERQVVSRKLNTNSATKAYLDMFIDVDKMLYNRAEQLEKMMTGCCYLPSRAHSIVPKELMLDKDKNDDLGRWIAHNYFKEHTLPQQYTSLDLLQKIINEHPHKAEMVHPIFQEWLQEQVVLRRLTGILMACDPARGRYQYQPFDEDWSMWQALYPENPGRNMYYSILEERGEKVRKCIRPQIKDYTMPSGPKNEAWHKKHDSAVTALHETWTKYEKATVKYYEKTRGFKAPWVEMVRQALRDTEPKLPFTLASYESTPVTTPEPKVIDSHLAVSSIPHHSSEVKMVAKIVTKKKQKELNPPPNSKEEVMPPIPEPSSLPREIAAPLLEGGEIAVKTASMDVVESLFSNAQNNVRAVRWRRFLNFMEDAGCSSEDPGGSRVTFTWRNVVDGSERKVVVHRPHPNSTLMAVHLRNYRENIEFCLGWTKDAFREK